MATTNCTNCGCKKCGCQDDFLTTPPACPTPLGCPDPEPCSEVLNAECVIYTGDPIKNKVAVVGFCNNTRSPHTCGGFVFIPIFAKVIYF